MFSTVLALLFILKIRLKNAHNVFGYFNQRYGADGLKKYRTLHNLSLKTSKLNLDLDYLIKCKIYNVFPKFLRFKLYKRSLHHAHFYKIWQSKLLSNEINLKKKYISKANARISLKNSVSMIDFFIAQQSIKSWIDSAQKIL